MTLLFASQRAFGVSEGTEAAVGKLERGEKYFSKDMALALAVLLVTHVFAHAHM